MHFYKATRFLFPSSFRLRIFSLCFVATHLPLATYILWKAADGDLQWAPVLVLLSGTLAGTGLALGAIHGLLTPIEAASDALLALEAGQRVGQLPGGGRDTVGRLLASVNRAALATDRLIQSLDQAATHDVLTGLYNRRGFLAQVGQADIAHRAGALAMLDLDHFKRVNDLGGHAAGDRVLRTFAALLEVGVRKGDVLGRWGGEEFVVVFPDTGVDEAIEILNRVARTVREQPLMVPGGGTLTFSAGVAVIDAPLDIVMQRADAALYAAKRAGRALVLAEGQVTGGAGA